MSAERKSKRQERREKIAQQERRSRLFTIGLIVIGAALVVFVVVWPQLRPVVREGPARPPRPPEVSPDASA